jgi:putative ABC transport system permease protein
MAFFVRITGPAMPAALARAAAAVNPATRGSDFVPYQEWIGAAIYPQRVAATLVGVVGAISLLLSSIGLYSVLAFAVNQRTHEFGIRIALGARSRHVFSAMLRQGMTLTLAGLGAGTLGAIVVLKVSAAFLPKLRTDDPAIFGGAILLLALVGFLASYLPARRATKVDPMVALRQE